MSMALKQHHIFVVSCPSTTCSLTCILILESYGKITEHSCDEYQARLETCKHDLKDVTLNDLYNNKGIVGNLLDSDYEPKVMLSATERVSRIAGSDVLKSKLGFSFKKKEAIDT